MENSFSMQALFNKYILKRYRRKRIASARERDHSMKQEYFLFNKKQKRKALLAPFLCRTQLHRKFLHPTFRGKPVKKLCAQHEHMAFNSRHQRLQRVHALLYLVLLESEIYKKGNMGMYKQRTSISARRSVPNTSTWPSTVATSASTEFMRWCIWCCWRVRFTKKGTWQCTNNEPLILQDDRLQLTRGLDKKGYLEKARLTPHTHSLQRHRVTVLPSVQKTWIPSYKTMVSEGRITMITISTRPGTRCCTLFHTYASIAAASIHFHCCNPHSTVCRMQQRKLADYTQPICRISFELF